MTTTPAPADRLLSEMTVLGLRPLHILIVILCGLGFTFEVAEFGMGNVLSAVFSAAPYTAPPAKLSWLLAAPYIGGVPGAALFGWLADRTGRKLALMSMLGLLGVASVAATWSHDIDSLTLLRILAGLALGGYPPVVIAFLTDHLPAGRRGALIMTASALSALGTPLSIFFIRGIGAAEPLGLSAWRWGFLVYGSASLVIAILFSLIPETVRWLAQAGRYTAAQAVIARLAGGREIFASVEPPSAPAMASAGPVRMKSWQYVASGLFNLAAPWATTAYPLLSGAVLIHKGIKLPDALLYVGLAATAPFVGMFFSSFVVDLWGRRVTLWATSALMALSALVFVIASAPVVLIGSGFAFQIGNSIFVPTASLYFAELFPTSVRARATSWLWALNRVGSVFAPLVLLPLMHTKGPLPLAGMIGAAMLLGMALLCGLPAGRTRQNVF